MNPSPSPRFIPALSLLCLTVVLAACQPAPPQLAYTGTSTIDSVDYDLELTFARYENRLTGEYLLDAVRGTFEGTTDGTALTAELSPSPDCLYAFTGTLTDAALTGTFEPTACAGGKPGAWDLTRR